MAIWTRRRFLEAATASAVLTSAPAVVLPGQNRRPQPQRNSPAITAGHYVPLLHENVARPLRYSPQDRAFVVRNGKEFFNRPLYGPNIPFRVDGGDLPEFSLYLPGHGGNIRLGIVSQQSVHSKWFFEFDSILASYGAGSLVYTLHDSLLGHSGAIHLQVLTVDAGLWLQLTSSEIPHGLELIWAFGGISGRKGKRNGDIGCEVEPVSAFFQMRPEECRGNIWTQSQWAIDPKQVKIEIGGKARKLYLLLAGTTFPQATGSTHATITVAYQDGESPTIMALRSPRTWWPIEQDYPVDDYIFLLGKDDHRLPWRVDLSSGRGRQLTRESLRGKGGPIPGGAAFVIEVDLDADRELTACTVHCNLYGIVLGLLGMTLERS